MQTIIADTSEKSVTDRIFPTIFNSLYETPVEPFLGSSMLFLCIQPQFADDIGSKLQDIHIRAELGGSSSSPEHGTEMGVSVTRKFTGHHISSDSRAGRGRFRILMPWRSVHFRLKDPQTPHKYTNPRKTSWAFRFTVTTLTNASRQPYLQ
ncbi:hypothetical protein [Rhizobium rhizogenes]|uniref:hypothetical protein n=1 Tax=Rhizobium rhizogenes TaxID=359 RepID=UPI001572BD92|nr:hypothetical protein [Rhizobium rhizogenes]NTH68591.1 hypothetical protein [Rhizobium rhizogenes]NTI39730.1 hypothetical protein [Rhizobium rhizogenes]WEO69788.1 hypothetical protein G6L54_033045 [Rhizobium rhizogenes]